MKRSIPACLAMLLLTSGYTGDVLAECYWEGGISGILDFNLRLANQWVPRDAPVGSVIGSLDLDTSTTNDASLNVVCTNRLPDNLSVSLLPSVPIFSGALPPVGGEDLTGRVLETGVPGIGIHIRMDRPYTGDYINFWKPRTWLSIPYEGYADHDTGPLGIYARRMRTFTTLIKTGPIPAGLNDFAGRQLFSGTFSDVGNVLRFYLHGSVTQAQCTLKADAVSADPVLLGDHALGDFTGVGYTTAEIPFHIRLNDCEDDPAGSTAQAHIAFDGVKGSAPIDDDLGLFSLTSTSTAAGIGIQLLHDDGRPFKLRQSVPVKPVQIGVTQLDFKARYYQTEARVTPGLAQGALSFTITYR